MCKTVDTQTHEAIVELIKTELDDIYDDTGVERLASLIEGRLGYGQETPKGCLPDITQGDWCFDITIEDRYVVVSDKSTHRKNVYGNVVAENITLHSDARLIAAAPKLAEALWDAVFAYDDPADVIHIDVHIDKFREALREAGADI